jgi:hypothetical protein
LSTELFNQTEKSLHGASFKSVCKDSLALFAGKGNGGWAEFSFVERSGESRWGKRLGRRHAVVVGIVAIIVRNSIATILFVIVDR